MNKQQVIDNLHLRLSEKGTIYPKWELNEIVESFLAVVSDSLEQGHNVSLTNFGKFSVKTHKGRNFHNIHTGRVEYTPDRKAILFSAKSRKQE